MRVSGGSLTICDERWREMPVWRCTQSDVCGEQWASESAGATCPFCYVGRGESTGFTCGEVAAAAERFGFGSELPIHIPWPVPDVVQLSTLPRDTWEGLPVFHPCGQDGDVPNWLRYDVGVIVNVFQDPDLAGEFRCRFVHSTGEYNSTLQYGPSNLWVPRALAARLR